MIPYWKLLTFWKPNELHAEQTSGRLGLAHVQDCKTALGQKRRFDNRPVTSGLPPTSDIADSASHVGFVPS